MYALDFEYDGKRLSSFGFILCTLGTPSGSDTVSAGSKITFNKVSRCHGKMQPVIGTTYDECITATFDICKNVDIYEDLHITEDEARQIIRWLNRREMLKFRLIPDEGQSDCYYNASFNVEKVLVSKELFALELTMETDSPFGYGAVKSVEWDITDTSQSVVLEDTSDEIGYIYPSMKITCKESGTLSIHNELEGCTMQIKNCSVGEVIDIDGNTQIIRSSLPSHKIYNDFNFEFFRIGNTLSVRDNKITVSLPVKLKIEYTPIIKDTPL